MWLDAITISLLTFPVHFSTHFKPILFPQHTLLVVTNLCHITSSRPPKKKINLQSPPNAPQECSIGNFPTILYLDSKNTTNYLKKTKVTATILNVIQCQIAAHQNWMNKFHCGVELSQNN